MSIRLNGIDDPKLLCRTCMGVDNELFDIFNSDVNPPTLLEMLTTCTALEISMTDYLPLQVCAECVKYLNMCYEFRMKCEQIDLELRRLFAMTEDSSIQILQHEPVKRESTLYEVKQEPYEMKVEIEFLPDLGNDLDGDDDLNDIGSDGHVSDSDLKLAKLKEKKINEAAVHKCSVCLQGFATRAPLRLHMKSHEEAEAIKMVHECAECPRKFDKASKLRRHLTVHNPIRKPYQCPHCLLRFKTHVALLSHVGVAHSEPASTNAQPDNIQTKVTEREINEKEEDKFACGQCPSRFPTPQSLSAHMRSHKEKDRVMACSVCGKVFTKWSHLQRHERSHPSLRPYACTHCTRTFANEDKLKEHNNKHTGIKPHCCPVCKKSFAELTTFTTHVRSHSRKKSFLCPSCGKCFDSSTNLNQHIRRHTGEKTFACQLCPGKYVSKGELQSHMSTHTGVRPFACDTCGSSFTKANSLAKHKLIHLGIRPHACDVCNMKFTSRDHLKRHRRIHTGEKPYPCTHCGRSFTQSNDLVKHTRSHLGDNMYKCSECLESFRLKTELRKHISSHFAQAAAEGKPAPRILSLAAMEIAPIATVITDPHPEPSSMVVVTFTSPQGL